MNKLHPSNFMNIKKVRFGAIYEHHFLTKSALIGFIIVALMGVSFIACSTKEKATAGQSELTKMEDIKKQIAELTTEKDKLTGELNANQSKYLSFQVNGDIKDKSSDGVMLFGSATPSNGDWSHEGATSSKSNIMVKAPKKDSFYASNFLATEVYYVGKTTGKNAFGASVPVLIFTTEAPSEISKVKNKVADIDNRIGKLNDEYAALYSKWKENLLSSIKDNSQELIRHGDDFRQKEDLDGAFRAYSRALELTPTNADVHVSLASIYLKQNNPDAAIEEYKKVLLINPQHADANKELGLILLNVKKDEVAATQAFREYLKNANTNDPDYSKIKDSVEKLAGTDRSYQEQGTALRQEKDRLEFEVKRSEKAGSKGEVEHYKEQLEKNKTEAENLSAKAGKWGVDSSAVKSDLKDERYYNNLEQEATRLRKDIDSTKRWMAPFEKRLATAKKYGHPDKDTEQMIAEKKQKIENLQERLQKIEAELTSKAAK